jgi:D-tyrosyl-tRNA(Tyr) deacylase
MIAVIQRVKSASVVVGEKKVCEIGPGFLLLVGIEKNDNDSQAKILAQKVSQMRIFDDAAGKMNLSIKEVNGAVLAVSQFTLCADLTGGRRPGFDLAARPEIAKPLFDKFVQLLKNEGLSVKEGVFQEKMLVSLENDGPVTFILDSKKL